MSNFKLRNGTYIQTIAYQLHELQHMLEGLISGGTGDICNTTTGTTDVVITNVVTAPNTYITVQQNYEPPIVSRPVNVRHETVVKPGKVIKIVKNDMHSKICGSSSPDSKYVNCIKCVDAYMAANPNATLLDLTPSGTGCYLNKPKDKPAKKNRLYGNDKKCK